MTMTPIEVKIELLLNKAQDPGATREESEAFMAAAQAKAARNAIDLEVMKQRMRDKNENPESSLKPTSKTFEMGTKGDRGAGAYTDLFWAIGRVNDLRHVMSNSEVTAYGMAEDIDITYRLYQLIVTQMVQACIEYIDEGEWKNLGVTRSNARKSFYAGYIRRIEERLQQAKREALNEADDEYGAGTSSLVLRDKKSRVNELYRDQAGKLASRQSTRATSYTVARKGRDSADKARLHSHAEVEQTRAIAL